MPVHRQFGQADRCRQPERLRRQALAGAQDGAAATDVLAALAHPFAGLRHVIDDHELALRHALLLHHDRIGARRNEGAREDARRGACRQRLAGMPGGDALRDRQPRADGGHVGRPHRIAVHLGVVGRGHVEGRVLVLGQHPGARVQRGHQVALRDRVRARQQIGQRVVKGSQG